MALGSLLLQPQALTRMQGLNDAEAFVDDVIALLQQIALNPENLETIGPIFVSAFRESSARIRAQVEPKLNSALEEIRAILAPFLDTADEVARQAVDLHDFGDFLALIGDLLERGVGVLGQLNESQIRDYSRRIHSLVTNTLGIDQGLLRDELGLILRTARGGLLSNVNTLSNRRAGVHLSLAALIGRLEEEMLPQLPVLDFNPDRLAHEIMVALNDAGLIKWRDQLGCIGEKIAAVFNAGAGIFDVAKLGVSTHGSVGAAARAPLSSDRYCWYASWLYATKRRSLAYKLGISLIPGFPDDEVWLADEKRQLVLRRAFKDDEVLHEVASGELDWKAAPQFSTASGSECYTFGIFGKQFLEDWTQASAVFRDLFKSIGHWISMGSGKQEYAANLPLGLWNFARACSNGAGAPLNATIMRAAGWNQGTQQIFGLVPFLSVVLGSIEGHHSKANGTNQFYFWLTLLGADVLNAVTIDSVMSGLHNGILEFFTLLNQQGPAGSTGDPDTRPHNRQHGDTLVGFVEFLANLVLVKVMSREDYSYPFPPNSDTYKHYQFLYAPLMGLAAGMVGTFIVWALSRSYDWGDLWKKPLYGAFYNSLTFVLQQYSSMEGDTDGGKYNPTKNADGTTAAPPRTPFKGYPDSSSSPYLLPFEAGACKFVMQGNQGMFSHMRLNASSQIYAYDFGHDFGDEILASRGGTVVDFFDWIPDDIDPDDPQKDTARTASDGIMGAAWRGDKPGWNFITIRHDTLDNAHDLDMGSTAVTPVTTTTYANYGHGKSGSVREVFNARGVAPGSIIGTVIQQGQVIMLAGDTGFSILNHLHMEVRSGPATGALPSRPVPTSIYSLPFVFRDADNLFGTNGVPKSLSWYRSNNTRVP